MNRLGDIAFASLLLAFTLPLMIIVALAIRCESPGPVFTRRSCIGHGGRRFHSLTFRTSAHNERQSSACGEETQIGRFLRYTRIEYLPQFINVLRGELGILDGQRRSPSFLY